MFTQLPHMKWLAALAIAATLTGAWLISGCTSQDTPSPSATASPSTEPVHASIFEATTHKSGNQLWSESCSRCHNIRPPEYYSDAQWDIVVHHMRLRTNLTGEEQRKIAEFLKASN